MTKRQNANIGIITLNDEVSVVGSTFQKRTEPIYVVDPESILLGVVTIGDFFRKAHTSRNVSELMNKYFIRVEETQKANQENTSKETASKLFSLLPNINEIPVIESNKLAYVLKRDKPYRHFDDGRMIRFNALALSLLEVNKGKKLIVLGDNEISRLIIKSVNNLPRVHFVDDIFAFAYDDPTSFFIVVIEPYRTFSQIQRDMASCNMVEGINYNLVCYKNIYHTYTTSTDAHLMYNRIMDLPGFLVNGNPHEAKLRIVALGASTTDPCFENFASWPEYLFDMLKDADVKYAVYNGGFAAYSSSLELTKLIRDVLSLEPDIVISYGGIADFMYMISNESSHLCKRPFLHHFHADYFGNIGNDEVIFGLQNDKTIDRFWVDNMRMMNSICREFGIKHLGVLQANPYSEGLPSKHIDSNWQIVTSHAYSHVPWGNEVVNNVSGDNNLRQIYDNVEALIKEIPYIHSFRNIFDGVDDVYYDGAHVQERGNEIIAAYMYETLKTMAYI